MSDIVVTGGNALNGSVSVLGAKNAVLKQQVAALLAPGKHLLENVPHIADVELMGDVLRYVGAECVLDGHTLAIDVPDVYGYRLIVCLSRNPLLTESRLAANIFIPADFVPENVS